MSLMDRWSGVLKVPLDPSSRNVYRVGVSLCLLSGCKTLAVPTANAIFFNGDRAEGTGNSVIERLSDPLKIAEVLVSKFDSSVNAWVVQASTFNGPFAVYRDFIPSVNRWGDPKSYSPDGFPASSTTVSLLSKCLKEAKNVIPMRIKDALSNNASTLSLCQQPKTYILGFSKGGTVVNQLLTELASSELKSHAKAQLVDGESSKVQEEIDIIPSSKEVLLNSITEIHYVDVGLNSTGAYVTDHNVIKGISKRLKQRGVPGVRFVLHGTPRQWCDSHRDWIREEKDRLVHLLKSEAQTSEGKLQVSEKNYFANRPPDLQMHFEVIERMDVS